ncbi:ATP-dependent RNA helicase RhlE [subsurface metagenome]
MALDPIKATKSITDKYRAYLSTTFRLKSSNLQNQFMKELQPEKFAKGPILEATPPFETGKSLEELVYEGILSDQFENLKSEEQLPLNRPLYRHQESAIRKVVGDNRNIVVTTGTGSGKTEAFLVPVLNHLFRQKENDKLTPGVRALLLYPMNALANDQLKRMRALLKNYPDITFGRYTGETEVTQKAARVKYRKMYNREPLPNELVSREQMREKPPHILLTNYAMLEYLMLRPEDHFFFDGEYANYWRFIVIDEAHTYNGAKGIEMAMLLRRLKDRIVQSQPGRIQCIATSATLGGGEKDFSEVAKFARELFGESFEPQYVITAIHQPMAELGTSWGKPDYSLYKEWQKIINETPPDSTVSALIETGVKNGVPIKILKDSELQADNEYKRFLYYVMIGDERLISLKQLLKQKPQLLNEVAEEIFPNLANPQNTLVALVDLAVQSKPGKDDQPLIPARYHLFVRAIEGAYLSLLPEKKIYLERYEKVKYDGKEYPVYEIATCRQCGAVYLVGETQKDEDNSVFKQPGKRYFESTKNLKYYLLLDDYTQLLPNNEDELVNLEEDLKGERYKICAACGAIDKANLINPFCDCGEENYFELLKVKSKDGKVHKCPACTRTNPKGSMVWRFLLGKDAIASVLATSLYQQIPSRKRESENHSEHNGIVSDDWSSTVEADVSNEVSTKESSDGQQLLIFSDSRQDAAFFAPYLSRTYSQILRRHLILKTIDENKDKILENKWRVQDLIIPLKQLVSRLNLFPDKSPQGQENEVWKWLLYELLSIDNRIGLEGLGCLGFSLVKPENWKAPEPLTRSPWKLPANEVWILFQVLLDSFRKNGAILFPDNVSPTDEFFQPTNREYYFRENGSMPKRHIRSWNPSSENATNARLDFIMRLAQRMGIDVSRKECIDILKNIWQRSLELYNPSSCWREYFSSINLRGEGTVYRMKYNFWELQPGTINKNIQWYYCDKCNNITLLNLRGVCPTYQCQGELQRCNPEEVFANNHYRNLYLEVLPLRMEAKEHTAQLTSEAAAELQTQFIEGDVNVLSCSTTFELGVDVGELESVFMRNVPPSAANYIQRAGRAGRRTDSTAFALTFCQRRSHDLTHFNDPMRMVSGEIKPPHFKIENEKIVKRHIYATALTKFWKDNREMFGKVESFFFKGDKKGSDLFKEYLDSKPGDLHKILKRIVPETLYKDLEIDTWGWVSGLFDKDDGVLLKATEEAQSDVENLEKVRKQLSETNKPSDYILRVINTIKNRYLINFLSSRNVIPKYGFPVDVVELQIRHHSDEAKRLELDRDLRIALSEYAPSSQIVAGGKLWTSRYLKKLPQREWPKYRYAVCEHCQLYQRGPEGSEEPLENCRGCGRPLEGKKQGTFLKPEFGFIASTKPPAEPGEEQPEKTYTTRTYYSGESDKRDELPVKLKNNVTLRAVPASHGKMAVINHAGYQRFKICHRCGYTILGNEKVKTPHKTPFGTDCSGKLQRYSLGHEYMTDILQLHFEGYANPDIGFWFSILYALLEGASGALDINRQDLDGCLYSYTGDLTMPALILFDDVPGGAGHVHRIAQNEATIKRILQSAYQRMEGCKCGGEEGQASCYGCLRNYRNQFCHDKLDREKVISFLEAYFK